MKTLTRIVLAALIFCSTVATQAGPMRGYFRSNGTYVAPYCRSDYGSLGGYSGYSSSSRDYVYRNPYAAYPSVNVRGYENEVRLVFRVKAAAVESGLKVSVDATKLLKGGEVITSPFMVPDEADALIQVAKGLLPGVPVTFRASSER